nr:reverse transcriptase domain-containing protein [Tanacetum cinerariifolium]
MRTRSRSRHKIAEPLHIEFPSQEDQFQEDPPEVSMVDNQTMAQLLQAPTEGYEDAIVILEIAATNFELKHGFIELLCGWNFLDKMPSDCLKIIESKSKVLQSRAKAFVAKVNSRSSTPSISSDVAELKDMVRALLLDKKNQYSAPAPSLTPAPIKVVEPNCVTCSGTHSYQNCPTTSRNVYQDNIQEYVSQAAAANYGQGNIGFRPQMVNQNRGNNFNQNRGGNFNQSNLNQGQLHRPQVNQPLAYQALAYQAPVHQTQSVSQTDFERYVKANDAVLRNIQSHGSGTLPGNTITNPKEDLKGITTRSGVAYQGPTIPTPSKVTKQGTEVTKDQVQTSSSQSTAPVQPPVVQSEYETLVFEPVVAPVSAPMPNLKSSTPYPLRRDNERRRDQANEQIEKFYEIFKDMSFEISFTDALILMPKFASTLKALIGNKEKLSKMARTLMNEHCSAVILNKLPRKLGDPGKFIFPCEFPGMDECLALADLGASINLMPLSVWKGLSLPKLTLTCMTLELADRSVSKPIGIAKDVSVKVGVFHFPAEFVVVDFEPDPRVPLILRRYSANYDQMTANKIDVTDMACEEYSQEVLGFSDVTASVSPTPSDDPIVSTTSPTLTPFGDSDFLLFEEADAFLELGEEEKSALIKVLKSHKRAIAWKLSDIQEVEKLLDAGLIYPISDSPWVSPVHCVPKKGGFIVVKNEENELIPTRSVIGWRVCIDYRKLNEATRKDHFPLPFMDQMLERLAGNEYYCFLDGFSGCMLAIFHDMVEKMMEVFMDNFSVFGSSFENCLSRLDKMLQRCEDTKLCLNWEKSHFMVKEGIVLGHKISKNGIEVDKAKIDVITKLHHPTTVKGAVLGQRHEKHFKPIYFASKTMTDAESKYTTTEKEMLAVVYAFEKFRFYLIMNKSIVHTDHSALKYLFAKKDAKARLLRWVLLPQEFDFDVINTKGAENLAVDHLSRLENPYENVLDPKEINETFPLETVSMVTFRGDSSAPWFTDFANYHAGNFIVKAKALPTNDARVVCKFLKSLFARFGAPQAIISDHGTHFCNDQFEKVMRKYGVTHRLSTAYHPQTSGQVEVSNRGLKRILERTIGQNRASWSDKLDDALWAFRTAYKTPIACTPYKLVYGKACHLLMEHEHKAYWAQKQANFDLAVMGDQRKVQLNELNELRDHAYENSLIYKEKTKRIHDFKIKNRVFNVGDRVFLFNSRLKIFSSKLKTRWSGPFTITKVFPYGTVELSQANGPNFKVNGHRIKHYFGGDVPQLVVLDLQTFPLDQT